MRLNGADPGASPLIDPNYLADERDVERMVVALRTREVGEAKVLSSWPDRKLLPGSDVRDDAACSDIRQAATIFYHPVGTCRIAGDDGAVGDTALRVYGIDSCGSPSDAQSMCNTCWTVGVRAGA